MEKEPMDVDGMLLGKDGILFSFVYIYLGKRVALLNGFDHVGPNKFEDWEPKWFDDAFEKAA